MKDYKGIVQRTYPKAAVTQAPYDTKTFYITKDPSLILGAYCIVGSGQSPENAWKSAVRRLRKAER